MSSWSAPLTTTTTTTFFRSLFRNHPPPPPLCIFPHSVSAQVQCRTSWPKQSQRIKRPYSLPPPPPPPSSSSSNNINNSNSNDSTGATTHASLMQHCLLPHLIKIHSSLNNDASQATHHAPRRVSMAHVLRELHRVGITLTLRDHPPPPPPPPPVSRHHNAHSINTPTSSSSISQAQFTNLNRKARRIARREAPTHKERLVVRDFLKTRHKEWIGTDGATTTVVHGVLRATITPLERRNQFISAACVHVANVLRHTHSSATGHITSLSSHHNLSHEDIYQLVLSELGKMERASITERHKDLAQHFVAQKAQLHDVEQLARDIPALCEEASKTILHDLPRHQLYFIIWNSLLKRRRKSPTEITRCNQIVEELLEEYFKENDGMLDASRVSLAISMLCNRAEERGVVLPRHQLHGFVKRRVNRIFRQRVTKDQEEFIREYVAQKKSGSNSETPIKDICANVHRHFNGSIPKDVVRKIVLSAVNLQRKQEITEDEREFIARYVNTSVHSIKEWCDKLQKRFPNIPRQVLYVQVKNQLEKHQRREVRKARALNSLEF